METTISQWLYTELRKYVDKIIICDPHRNKLLSEGPKGEGRELICGVNTSAFADNSSVPRLARPLFLEFIIAHLPDQ